MVYRYLPMICVLFVPTCGPKPDGDTEGDPGTTGAPNTTGSGVTGSEPTTAATTAAADNPCEALAWHGCLPVADCDVSPCGEPGASHDANGCLRGSCGDDSDCLAGEVCYRPVEWGGCAGSISICELDEGGDCVCGGTDDCGGSYCELAELVPQTACLEQTQEPACLELGCNQFEAVAPQLVLGPTGCECGVAESVCLFLPAPDSGDGVPALHYRLDTDEVRLFSNSWAPEPIGWFPCFDNPGEPEACACDPALCG
jgi:hypothetical protein